MSPLIFLVIIFVAGLLLYGIVLTGTVNSVGKNAKAGKKNYRGHLDRAMVAERWATIHTMSVSGGGNGLRQAVSEADKLFDYVMKTQGYAGETMADRLRSAQSKLSDRNAVWSAHKLRNALAHEVGFDLVASQVQEALRGFERGLKDLGAL
jgi:hypothetical protein